MHYPINVAAFIADMQKQLKDREKAEEFCRVCYIPALKDAYRAGKAGTSGYLMDSAEIITSFEAAKGPLNDRRKRLIAAFTGSLNAAYTQGQQAAGRVAI